MRILGQEITKYTAALSAIVLVSAFLRVYHIDTQSLWFDEAFSVWVSKMGLLQIIQTTAVDVHPPFYYFILHYWMSVFGDSEFAVRLLSALFGLLAIPIIYLVGRQLFDKEVGLVAALILALSSFNVQYSQEARMYTLMVLLALLSMYFFLRVLQRSSLTLSVGYVLSTTLLLYTHLYGLFVLIAQNVYVVTLLVLSKDHTLRVKRWVLLQVVTIALFVPWIPHLVGQTSRALTGQPLAILGTAFFGFEPPTVSQINQTFILYAGTTYLLVLFLGLSALSLFKYKKTHGSMNWKAPFRALEIYSWDVRIVSVAAVWFLALWVSIINVIPFAISHFSVDMYQSRSTIAASVALYLLVAAGIRNINHKYVKLAVIVVIVVLLAAPLQTYYSTITKRSGREAFGFVDANVRSGDVGIIFPVNHIVVADYYNKRTDINFTSFGSGQKSNDENIKELNASLTGSKRVWFVYPDPGGPNNVQMTQILKAFNESYETASSAYFTNGYDVYLFVKRN